jgi:hypothetical protein
MAYMHMPALGYNALSATQSCCRMVVSPCTGYPVHSSPQFVDHPKHSAVHVIEEA